MSKNQDPVFAAMATYEEAKALFYSVDETSEPDRHVAVEELFHLALNSLEATQATTLAGLVAKLQALQFRDFQNYCEDDFERLLATLQTDRTAAILEAADIKLVEPA